MTRGHLTEYSWNAPVGTRDTRDILFRQRHDSYRVSFNVYPGETAKLKIKTPEPRPPPYQRHAVTPHQNSHATPHQHPHSTPHQNPHATSPDKDFSDNMIKKRLSLDKIITYAIVSLSNLDYLAHKGMLTKEDHNCKAPVWAFGGPLTIRIIWELIPVALLYFWGVLPPPTSHLRVSANIEFLSSGSITFLWTLPHKYCTIFWSIFGFPLYFHGLRCSVNTICAFQISYSLRYGSKYKILGKLYQGEKHCVLFLVYSCLSLVCAIYAYWGSYRYFSPIYS